MIELIKQALSKGAKIYSSISGGKDGQAMTKMLHEWGFPIEGLIHADLGKVEWEESISMCQRQSEELNVPLFVVKRADGLGLLEYWQKRMHKLQGKGIPFWSSSASRYCTSDLKRGPINAFFTSTGHNFIISCEGIRAEESPARAKKEPLTVKDNSSKYYKYWHSSRISDRKKVYKPKSVEWCLENYDPKKRLILTWYPIFNFTLEEVWNSYGGSQYQLNWYRQEYDDGKGVNPHWKFHSAYVKGNDRVSCKICILGSLNDMQNGADSDPELLDEMIGYEEYSGFTFKQNWSLKQLKK